MPKSVIAQRIKDRALASGAKLWAHPIWRGLDTGPLVSLHLPDAHFFARHATPLNGDVVIDIAKQGNASFVIPTTTVNAPPFKGGGIEWSGLASTAQGAVGIDVPAGAAAAIDAAANQYFLVMFAVKLPSTTAWPLAAGNLAPWVDFSLAGAGNSYQNNPSLIAIGPWPNATNRRIAFIRQTASPNVAVTSYLTFTTYPAGEFAVVAFWRNAAGSAGICKTLSGVPQSQSIPLGVENSADLSAVVGKIGPRSAFSNLGNAAIKTLYAGTRQYDMHVENLSVTGRDPQTVIDEYWTFLQAQIAAGAIDPAAA